MKVDWSPSPQEQHLQWWAQFALKYLIGGGGLIWETAIDHLRNATAFVVFGGIAGIADVLGYRAQIRAQAEAAARATAAAEAREHEQ